MPSTTTDRLPPFAGGPGTSSFARPRDARVVEHTRELAADALAGRTVWCIHSTPSAHAAAVELHACLAEPAEDRIAAARHRVEADERLRRLAAQLDRMLAGAAAGTAAPGAEQRELYAAGVRDGEALLGADVRAGDVVVLHDALAAALAEAVRERGAHAVRHVSGSARTPDAYAAWEFLRPFEHAVDAWVLAGPSPGPAVRERRPRRLTAAMPAPSHVARKEVAPDASPETPAAGLCWRAVLADVIGEDREEHVGGTIHARPAVPAH